jgi:hypothetical protein
MGAWHKNCKKPVLVFRALSTKKTHRQLYAEPIVDPIRRPSPSFLAFKYFKTFIFGIGPHIRGVLGNKCAGHHNSKTVKMREIVLK